MTVKEYNELLKKKGIIIPEKLTEEEQKSYDELTIGWKVSFIKAKPSPPKQGKEQDMPGISQGQKDTGAE